MGTSNRHRDWEAYEALLLRLAPSIVRELGLDASEMTFEAHPGKSGAYGADHQIDVLGRGPDMDVLLECKAYERPLERKDVYAIRGQYQSVLSVLPDRRMALVVVCQSGIRDSVLTHLRDPEEVLYRAARGPIHVVTVPPLFSSAAMPVVEFVDGAGSRVFVAGQPDSRSTDELFAVMDRSVRFRDRVTAGSQLLSRELSIYDRRSVALSISDALLHLGQPVVSQALAEAVLNRRPISAAEQALHGQAIVRVASALFQRTIRSARRGGPGIGERAVTMLSRAVEDLDESERAGAELFLASWHARQPNGGELARRHMRAAYVSLQSREGTDREYGGFLFALRRWEQQSPEARIDTLDLLETPRAALSHPHHAAIAAMIVERARREDDVSIWTAFNDDEIDAGRPGS